MRRVSVVGNSGSGKTTFGRRLSELLRVPFVELDSLHHLPDWQPIDPPLFVARVREMTDEEGWVIDGNYRAVVSDGPVWERADTVIWLDMPTRVHMYRVVRRTLRRVVTREELWNGNREPFSNLYRLDPTENVIVWSWTNRHRHRARLLEAMDSPAYSHLDFVRLRTRAAAANFLRNMP